MEYMSDVIVPYVLSCIFFLGFVGLSRLSSWGILKLHPPLWVWFAVFQLFSVYFQTLIIVSDPTDPQEDRWSHSICFFMHFFLSFASLFRVKRFFGHILFYRYDLSSFISFQTLVIVFMSKIYFSKYIFI